MNDKDPYSAAAQNADSDSATTARDAVEHENLAATDATASMDAASVAADLEKEKLIQELADANAKAQANWDLLLRSKAETENIRRRGQADVEKAQKFCIEGFAKELLNVVDSLDKALELAVSSNSELDPMQQGMKLTHKLLLDTLDKFGIKEINPLGEMFDPAKHEALSMQESDSAKPNSILMVVQKGFSIYERMLRPARVIVARSSAGATGKVDERA